MFISLVINEQVSSAINFYGSAFAVCTKIHIMCSSLSICIDRIAQWCRCEIYNVVTLRIGLEQLVRGVRTDKFLFALFWLMADPIAPSYRILNTS